MYKYAQTNDRSDQIYAQHGLLPDIVVSPVAVDSSLGRRCNEARGHAGKDPTAA